MLHVNLLRWRNLIDWLSRDIGQYPMIEMSNWGYGFHHKMCLFEVFQRKNYKKFNKMLSLKTQRKSNTIWSGCFSR